MMQDRPIASDLGLIAKEAAWLTRRDNRSNEDDVTFLRIFTRNGCKLNPPKTRMQTSQPNWIPPPDATDFAPGRLRPHLPCSLR
jgi:hypothetical protein